MYMNLEIFIGLDALGHAMLQAMAANRIERLKLQIRRIEAAIDRCRAGSYGICCRCEAEIEAERLRADPATPFCTACTRET